MGWERKKGKGWKGVKRKEREEKAKDVASMPTATSSIFQPIINYSSLFSIHPFILLLHHSPVLEAVHPRTWFNLPPLPLANSMKKVLFVTGRD